MDGRAIGKLAIRALVIGAVEVVAFGILSWLLRGVHVETWQAALVAVIVLGALNISLRPLILWGAVNLGLIPFAIIALLLNAFLILLVARWVPGFSVDGILPAFVMGLGLASLNALVTGMLSINDDDSFYRNVIRKLARRRAPTTGLDALGTVIIQIDGLAEPILRSELEAGNMPTLQRWIAEGSHKLVRWECDVPSMTSSGQSGILYGNNSNIPAFRWYEKETGQLLVSNHPKDAQEIDRRQATDHGLMREQGSSVGNIFAGGADRCVLTMCRLTGEEGKIKADPRDLYDFLVNPYNLYRDLSVMLWEVVVEYRQAWQQRRRNEIPRMHRSGVYPWVRAMTTVMLRDITTWMLLSDMFSGKLVAYADYLGYDEVAHHSGPSTEDARGALRQLDNQFRQLEVASRRAPRKYQFVVLSDHGQSTGPTFLQRYGQTLEQVIRSLMQGREDVEMTSGSGEGWGQLNALLTEAVRAQGLVGSGARRLAGQKDPNAEPAIELDPSEADRAKVERAEVVVCASGNLAQVYFARRPGRLSLEYLVAEYPGLVEGLADHPGIGFMMLYSEVVGGPVVMGHNGSFRSLVNERGRGDDPLAPFSPHTAGFLRRMSTYPNVGDIMLNSLVEPETGWVAAFEELIGCHGGAGGLQTSPLLLYPAHWSQEPPEIIGSENVHRFLLPHVGPPIEQPRELLAS